jgi:predicted transcriptional regulator
MFNLEDIKMLKKLRLQANLTQWQLAKKANTTQSTIAKIEAGKLDPSLKLAKRILDVLNVVPSGKIKAKDVMITAVQSFLPSSSLKEAIDVLFEKGFSQAPVIKDKRIVGTISESSIISNTMDKDLSSLTVNDAMDEILPSIPPNANIEPVIFLLKYNPAILVISQGNLSGIITRADIMQYLLVDEIKT